VHEDRLPCKGSPRKTKSSSWVNLFLENTIKNYLFQSASRSYQSVSLTGLRSQSILFNDWWNVPRGRWSTFPKVFRFEFVVPRTLIANASRSVTLDPLHDEISFYLFPSWEPLSHQCKILLLLGSLCTRLNFLQSSTGNSVVSRLQRHLPGGYVIVPVGCWGLFDTDPFPGFSFYVTYLREDWSKFLKFSIAVPLREKDLAYQEKIHLWFNHVG